MINYVRVLGPIRLIQRDHMPGRSMWQLLPLVANVGICIRAATSYVVWSLISTIVGMMMILQSSLRVAYWYTAYKICTSCTFQENLSYKYLFHDLSADVAPFRTSVTSIIRPIAQVRYSCAMVRL